MGFLGSLLQAAVDTVSVPIAMTQDLIEGGKNDRTARRVEKVGDDIAEAFEFDSLL